MALAEASRTASGRLNLLFRQAVAQQQAGHLQEAAEILYAILAEVPTQADCLRLLGGIEVLRGKAAQAERLLRAAIAANPEEAEAYNNLGMALVSRGRPGDAVPYYERAIALRPGYAAAFNNLGNALATLERPQDAVRCFQAALSIQPDFPLARTNLGAALAALNRYEEALAEHRQALAEQENNAAIHLNLAATLQAAGRDSEALPHLAAARNLQPQLAAVHVRLGSALQETGQVDEARRCFERAVELEPGRPAHYLNLTGNMRLQDGNPLIAAMEDLARDDASLPDSERHAIHFALAKALTDIGQHERAFGHLLRGNSLKRARIDYDEAKLLGRLKRVREVFSADLLRRMRGKGLPTRQPIFILGMPRSGSTLVEQILASHPDVFAAGEVMAFRDAAKQVGIEGGVPAYPETVFGMTPANLRRLAAAYLSQMRGMAAAWHSNSASTPPRITDKLPSNFRYIGLIQMALPNARIIHTCRDPIDTCLSCFSTDFIRQPFTFDLAELGRYWRAYAELMAHWHAVLPSGVILDVHYEHVV